MTIATRVTVELYYPCPEGSGKTKSFCARVRVNGLTAKEVNKLCKDEYVIVRDAPLQKLEDQLSNTFNVRNIQVARVRGIDAVLKYDAVLEAEEGLFYKL